MTSVEEIILAVPRQNMGKVSVTRPGLFLCRNEECLFLPEVIQRLNWEEVKRKVQLNDLERSETKKMSPDGAKPL